LKRPAVDSEVEEQAIQAERYSAIAADYEDVHSDPEHEVAFWHLVGMLGLLRAESILDVGAGTGRVLLKFKRARPDLHLRGVEPVDALRNAGYAKGLSPEELTDGSGYALPFSDESFDVVCEFGVLHHVRHPHRMVTEMMRVARKAIFISDSNNFGGGSRPARAIKQTLHALRLWPMVNYLKTGGRGYSISRGDGLFYSYSVVDSLPLLRTKCSLVHMMNTTPAKPNLYRTANHLAVLAVKDGALRKV